jgi:hypothetical protein
MPRQNRAWRGGRKNKPSPDNRGKPTQGGFGAPIRIPAIAFGEALDRNFYQVVSTLLDTITPEKIKQIYRSAPYLISGQIQLAHDIEQTDGVIRGLLATRRKAVLRMTYKIESGEPGNPQADRAAEEAAKIVKEPWFRRASEWCLRSIFCQDSAVELIWVVRNGLFAVSRIRKVEPWRWVYDLDDETDQLVPMLYSGTSQGRGDRIRMNIGKFMIHRVDDNEIPGDFALLRAVTRDWYSHSLSAIDRTRINADFGMPTIKAQYPAGASKSDIQSIAEMLYALAGKRIILTEQGTTVDTEPIPDQSPHRETHEDYIADMARLILGQTRSSVDPQSASTGSNLQGEVRDDYRDDDAELLDASQRESFWDRWTAWNFGQNTPTPVVTRVAVKRKDPQSRGQVFQQAQALGLLLKRDEVYKDLDIEVPADKSGVPLVPEVIVPKQASVPEYGPPNNSFRAKRMIAVQDSARMQTVTDRMAAFMANLDADQIQKVKGIAMREDMRGGTDEEKFARTVDRLIQLADENEPELTELLYLSNLAAIAKGELDVAKQAGV